MKPKKIILFAAFLLGSVSLVFAWGAWGHQHINRAAIFPLPSEMRVFFYNHADYLTQESDMPDVRKHLYHDRSESARHFINLETYGSGMLDSLPLTEKEALVKYGAPFLEKNGVLPWCIPELMDSLTAAFRLKRKTYILFLAANLGHYIGDAHMPLHTSVNHDGLQTGQRGIHGFWEGQIPEMFGDKYNFYTGAPKYIEDVTRETRRIIADTYSLADSLLSIDRRLKEGLPENQIYKMDAEGHIAKSIYGDPVHSREYAKKFHVALKGMVERQLRAAVHETSSFWYTAWVNAGKPDLRELDSKELTQRNQAPFAKDYRRWQQGKVDMISPELEY